LQIKVAVVPRWAVLSQGKFVRERGTGLPPNVSVCERYQPHD
jgi:hypothetical protein